MFQHAALSSYALTCALLEYVVRHVVYSGSNIVRVVAKTVQDWHWLVLQGTARYCAVLYGTVRYSEVLRGAVRCCTVPYGTVRY